MAYYLTKNKACLRIDDAYSFGIDEVFQDDFGRICFSRFFTSSEEKLHDTLVEHLKKKTFLRFRVVLPDGEKHPLREAVVTKVTLEKVPAEGFLVKFELLPTGKFYP